jgi:uncharacterized protein (DUF305 family)
MAGAARIDHDGRLVENARSGLSCGHVRRRPLILTALLWVAGACQHAPVQPPRVVQPGAPGQASREGARRPAPAPGFTAADVTFMQGMIGHHRQAVEMVELLKTRSSSRDMQLLGLRIEVSQRDEIKMMQTWLETRGQSVPGEHAMHMHDAVLMPGMLSGEEMDALAAAKGVEFDKRFLEGMIKHHGGALVMVRELFASAGAAQGSEIFAFASDVEADQQMEIDRMRAMRAALGRLDGRAAGGRR